MRVIDTLGARNIIITAKRVSEEELPELRKSSLGLSLRELQTLAEAVPGILHASARKRVNVLTVFSASGKSASQVFGVSPSYFLSANFRILEGRFLDAYDDRTFAQVCVLGRTAKRRLFGLENAIGRAVKVQDVWLVVVGVLEDRTLGQEEFEGVKIENINNNIYLPIQTVLKKYAFPAMENEIDEIQLTVSPDGNPKEAAVMAGAHLEKLHNKADDYSVVIPQALFEQHRSTQRIFNIVMGCIAGISLLVGGIGIMNIMLANVLERTNEIGLRRALGARRRDIRNQFLIEALTVSLLGGVLGVGFGEVASAVVAATTHWQTAVTLFSILLSFGVSAAVGVIFGYYPAAQASNLNPVEALRYE
jgi:putative ABC transport system permease protein